MESRYCTVDSATQGGESFTLGTGVGKRSLEHKEDELSRTTLPAGKGSVPREQLQIKLNNCLAVIVYK